MPFVDWARRYLRWRVLTRSRFLVQHSKSRTDSIDSTGSSLTAADRGSEDPRAAASSETMAMTTELIRH
jgi:hypothetical protein